MAAFDGEMNGDAGAAAGRALVLEAAAVLDDDAAREHDPEPGAVGARGEERRADARQRLGRDAAAAVADADLGAAVAPADLERDRRARRAGLDGVLYQVDERLLEPAPVGGDGGVAGDGERHAGDLGAPGQGRRDLAGQDAERD